MSTATLPAYVQIEDNRHLIRDTRSMAVINTDEQGLKAYRVRRASMLANNTALAEANHQIQNLQTQFAELKQLVLECINRNQDDGK